MANFKTFVFLLLISFYANANCKIILPHKLRYLENMLNAEVMAKAAKIRQRIEENPNIQDSDKSWPLLLAKYQAESKKMNYPSYAYDNIFNRRLPNFK